MDTVLITIPILFICMLGLSWFAGSDAPYVPTKLDKIARILQLAAVKNGKIFYELGSGDGRVVFEAAKLGADSYGVEQSWIRVWLSRLQAHKTHLQNAHFFHGNLFDRNYYPADIVYVYLLRPAVFRLESKLKNELKKGSVVVTQTYHFDSWKPYRKGGDFWFYRA